MCKAGLGGALQDTKETYVGLLYRPDRFSIPLVNKIQDLMESPTRLTGLSRADLCRDATVAQYVVVGAFVRVGPERVCWRKIAFRRPVFRL